MTMNIVKRNPGCALLILLIGGGIQPPDTNLGYTIGFAVVVLLLISVLWSAMK